MRAGARKQALVPAGATVLEPVGTAPGLLLGSSPLVAVLPGPPRELQTMWRDAVSASPLVASCCRAPGRWSSGSCASSRCPSRRSPRRCASSTPTRCRWRSRPACGAGSSRWRPSSSRRRRASTRNWRPRCASATATVLFSDDGATIDEVIARLLAGRTIATAESCTGGLMAGRLTDLAGSSAYVLGRARRLLQRGQDRARGRAGRADRGARGGLARGGHGACRAAPAPASAPTSGSGSRASPARAGRRRPSRSGTVCISVSSSDDAEERTVHLPGGRADVRDRTTTVALHMLRALLLRA